MHKGIKIIGGIMLIAIGVVLLTPKQALDLHCKLQCVDSEGFDSGHWDNKNRGCVCEFLLLPALKLKGLIVPKKRDSDW